MPYSSKLHIPYINYHLLAAQQEAFKQTKKRKFSGKKSGEWIVGRKNDKTERARLQALVYDILPPTTAITECTIGLGKLSANGQFFIGAQTAVSL